MLRSGFEISDFRVDGGKGAKRKNRLLTPALSSVEEERENCFVGVFPRAGNQNNMNICSLRKQLSETLALGYYLSPLRGFLSKEAGEGFGEVAQVVAFGAEAAQADVVGADSEAAQLVDGGELIVDAGTF